MKYSTVFIKRLVFWILLSSTLLLSACSQKVSLFDNLTQQEANEVYSLLLRAGFSVTKVQGDNGYAIQVPDSMAGEALDLLITKGFPRDKKNSINEIFPNDSMITSPLQEKARYLYALSQELERTLMTIDGVIEARVHIVLPERASIKEGLNPSSVAVFVKHEPSSPLMAYKSQIQSLILSSIPTLANSNIEQSVSIVAIPSSVRLEQPLSLVWFGPLAIKSAERYYLLALIHLVILLWLLSVASVYLSCVEPSRRPKFMQNFFKPKMQDEPMQNEVASKENIV
jgi:type III secretion protein J